MKNQMLHLALALLFVASALPVLVPTVEAQSGSDASTDDDADDVRLLAPSPDGAPTPVEDGAVPNEIVGPIDLTEVRFYGESPTEVFIGYSVSSFARPTLQALSGFSHVGCFQNVATGDWYHLRVAFQYATGGAPSAASMPIHLNTFLDRLHGECDPFSASGDDTVLKHRVSTRLITTQIDYDAGNVDVRIPRMAFGDMPLGESLAPVPARGDVIAGLKVTGVMQQGKNHYFFDETPSIETAFTTDTGNDKVRVVVHNNFRSIVAGVASQGGIPLYGVETGGFQTVPLTIENDLDEPIDANLTYTVVSGDASKWDVRLIPSIPVGQARQVTVDGESMMVPGAETVTLLVNSDLSVPHKERLRLLVEARDGRFPGILGAALVDVMGVQPPTKDRSTLYFHAAGDPCTTASRWLNTLRADPGATESQYEFTTCARNGEIDDPTSGGGTMRFAPDVPFARDYEVSTAESTEAIIALRSMMRVPGAPDQEVEVPLTANVDIQVLAGSALLGEGQTETTVNGGIVDVKVPLEFQGLSPGATTRFVPADEPISVRLTVTPISRTFEVCNSSEPCKSLGGQRDVQVPASLSGRVFLVLDRSSIDLPVISSTRSGPDTVPTASGALMSLRLSDLDGETRVFTNPGKVVVYNLTVRNEGVNVDTALLSAEVNATGWQLEILPKTEFRLAVGEPRVFNVRITAPETAPEGHTAGIKIVATSQVDPEAQAKLPLAVTLTRGTQFEDQVVDPKLQEVDQEESPSASVLLLVGVLAVGSAMMRRRPC